MSIKELKNELFMTRGKLLVCQEQVELLQQETLIGDISDIQHDDAELGPKFDDIYVENDAITIIKYLSKSFISIFNLL